MLDFSFGELALVVFVALVIVGPKDLPVLMYRIGRWIGQLKGIGDEFRSGFRSAMDEAAFESMKKDLHEIHDEIQYIRDMEGNLQPVYDISDYLTQREQEKIHAPVHKEPVKSGNEG